MKGEFEGPIQGPESGIVTPGSPSLHCQIYRPEKDVYISQFGFNYYNEDKLSLELISDPRPLPKFLIYTDWIEATRDFIVEKVGKKEVILQSGGKRYIFSKF